MRNLRSESTYNVSAKKSLCFYLIMLHLLVPSVHLTDGARGAGGFRHRLRNRQTDPLLHKAATKGTARPAAQSFRRYIFAYL